MVPSFTIETRLKFAQLAQTYLPTVLLEFSTVAFSFRVDPKLQLFDLARHSSLSQQASGHQTTVSIGSPITF